MWISSVKFCASMTTRSLDNFIPPGKPELGDPSGDRDNHLQVHDVREWLVESQVD
jgi:hypothetical protein